MKKAQPSGTQNRKKESQRKNNVSTKEALNTWIKICRIEVEETGNNEAAENS